MYNINFILNDSGSIRTQTNTDSNTYTRDNKTVNHSLLPYCVLQLTEANSP